MMNKSVDLILSAVKSAGEAALRLHEENESLRERLRLTQNPGLAVRQQAADTIESLTAENAALRKDAERYRWLRTQHANILLGPVHVAGVGALTPTGLDAAIDAHLGREAKP